MQNLPVPIIRTKLYPPPMAQDTVQRQRLLSLAQSAEQSPLTLVSAPAGYGKSTLVAMHVPPPREAVRDCMPVLFDLLGKEPEPAVRVILGHFLFVYIHPYVDGNGRMGRFLMNTMLASGGYPWTVIPVEKRDIYMAALEEASVGQNIAPFAEFLARLVDDGIKGKSVPKVPS